MTHEGVTYVGQKFRARLFGKSGLVVGAGELSMAVVTLGSLTPLHKSSSLHLTPVQNLSPLYVFRQICINIALLHLTSPFFLIM